MKQLWSQEFRVLLVAALTLAGGLPAWAANKDGNVQVTHDSKHDVSPPLRQMALTAALKGGEGLEKFEKEELRPPKGYLTAVPGNDPVVQERYLPQVAIKRGLSFDGINHLEAPDFPPDTNGTVGATQFVEQAGAALQVYDKATGKALLPKPVAIDTLFQGFGGLCETTNGGDSVVLWDKLAQQWFVSQLGDTQNNPPYFLCIAISTTADATGSYYRYSFAAGQNLPDYPKYGVWPDAYYGSSNVFNLALGKYYGAQPCAFDRAAMLAGQAATMICMTANAANFTLLPSDLDGQTLPPSGEPNHYVELGSQTNELNEFDFHVDFVNPQNSTFTGPNVIAVPNYLLPCNDGPRCVPQPSPGENVDALSGRLMFRLAYRNFGDHESMVATNAVAPGTGSTAAAAVRWYELRSTGGAFSLYQSGTYQSANDNLWMPSIAMDKDGDIAMGMSADSATSLDTSVWYTGRAPSDPLGQMEAPRVAVKGSAVQVNGSNRWGDYSSMSVDPSDDCTFWYTQEYYKSKVGGAESNDFSTHIVSFRFPQCQ
ncbi:MAG: hypothetical protein WBQ72_01015 [Terriglobales bacterium]|jgi:hypothetical protein